MNIALLKDSQPQEKRVALTPEVCQKLIAQGFAIAVEAGAGASAGFTDDVYSKAGASVVKSAADALKNATIAVSVQRLSDDKLAALPKGIIYVTQLNPHAGGLEKLVSQGVSAVALELIPRITRAQSMDVLSSQSNLAGYRAVIEAAYVYGRGMPMMMTAAGTVAPARVCILGAGVAGLQAIATAKRMGAIVSAFDVRAAVKEQVQSLGASFIEVAPTTSLETAGGYAKEADAEYKKRQAEKIHQTLKTQDIVISTALIPGRPAPVLITPEMVADMKPGSVILDMAVASGGNCPLSKADQIIQHNGVSIIGYTNLPSRLAEEASKLLAKNIQNLLMLMRDEKTKTIALNTSDEIIAGCLYAHGGQVVNAQFKPAPKAA